jgi:hypothetical protein
MPNTICLVAPAFSITGSQQIINQATNFSFLFNSPADKALALAYQWYVNDNLVINKNQDTFTELLPVGTYTIGGRLLTDEGWSGIKTIFFEILELGNTAIGNFDYMAVYFKWIEGAGQDLDIKVAYENTGTIYDNNYVGFNSLIIEPDGYTLPLYTTPETNAYLWWASDSEGSNGTESVLIGIQNFIDDNPSTRNIIEIGLYAGWHRFFSGTHPTGAFTVELITYLGGTMTRSIENKTFINTGGVPSGLPIILPSTVLYTIPKSYKKIGIIKYNKTSKLAQLQLV